MNLRHALLCITGIWCVNLPLCCASGLPKSAAAKKDDRPAFLLFNVTAWDAPSRSALGYRNPDVMYILTNRTVKAGKAAAFRCRVYGSPKPRIKWKKDGVTVTQSYRTRIRHTDHGSRLRIKNVQPSDAGYYQCMAKNNVGIKLSTKVYLQVKGSRKAARSRCEVYTGTLCNLHSFVHIPPGRAQHQIERKLRHTHNTLLNKYAISHRCRKHLLPLLCRLHYPSCSGRASYPPRRVCREECESLERKWCRRELKSSRAFRLQWRRIVTCGDLPSGGRQHKPAAGCVRVFGRGKAKPTSLQSNPPRSCIQYSGTVCKPYFKDGRLIALEGSSSHSKTEEALSRTLGRLNGYISTKCGKYLKRALCYYLFQPCTTGARQSPIRICKTQCEVLKGRVCSKEFRYARLFQDDSDVLPSCERLPSRSRHNGEPCLSLGFRVNESDSQSETNGLDRCSSFLKRVRKTHVMYPIVAPVSNASYSCGNTGYTFSPASRVSLPSRVLQILGNAKTDINKGHISTSRRADGSVKYCVNAQLVLRDVVHGWRMYLKSVPLTLMARPTSSTKIPGLEIALDITDKMTVLIPLGSAAVYQAHAKIVMYDVKFYYRQSWSNASINGSFIARGTYHLCETVFQVEVERTQKGVLRISGHSSSPLDIDTIERVFGLAMPSSMLFKAIKRSELLVMRLMDPSFEAYIDKHITIKFSGTSYMYIGWDARSTHLEFYAGRHHRTDLFIAGLTSQELTFNEALDAFTGLNLPYLDFIEGFTDSSVGVLISTSTISSASHPRIHLHTQPLSTAIAGSVPRGLTIVSRSKLPRTCEGSKLCQLLLVVFGRGSRFTTSISANQDRVSINVALDKVSHDALVAYESAEITLKVVYGNMTLLDVFPYLAFNVQGNIRVSGKKSLQFSGQLDYDGIMSKLQGKFSSAEEWRDAFGVRYLTVKDLRIRMSVPTDSMSGQTTNHVSTDAVFEFGVGCQQEKGIKEKMQTSCISGYAHLGLSEDITEHYFYGNVRALTLRQLLRACDIHVQLPIALATIGFPKGLTISVAKAQHDLRPEGGPLVEPGLTLRGRVSVLGIETDATVSLQPREFLIDSDVSGDEARVDDVTPLQFANRRYGPKLYLKTRIDPKPFLKAHIDGYARIFGVFDEIRVLVTRDVTQIKMVADLHKSVKAYLYMTSNYSRHINTTHLQARVIFHHGLSKLTRLASKHVVVLLQKEKSQLRSAQGEAQRRSKSCAKTAKRECAACFGRPSCQAIVSSCRARERKGSSGRSLHTVCQRALFDGCQDSNGTCKQICGVIGSKLNGSCKAYREAAKTLQQLQRSLKWVKQAQFFISGTLFQIHGISFEANVSPYDLKSVFVDTTFDCTIFGQRHQLKGLKLRLDAFTHLASEIAKYAVTWYGKNSRYHGNRPKGAG